jgi:hypothetical protein
MGRTKTMLTITEVEYKNFQEMYTVFEYNGEVAAIEHEGYDVSSMKMDEDEVYEHGKTEVMTEDPEQFIHNYFLNV